MIFFTIYFLSSLFVLPNYVYQTGIDSHFRGNDIARGEDSIFAKMTVFSQRWEAAKVPFRLYNYDKATTCFRGTDSLFRKTACRLRVQGPWFSTKKDKVRPDKGKAVFLNEYRFRKAERQQLAFLFTELDSRFRGNDIARREDRQSRIGKQQDQKKINSKKPKMTAQAKKPTSKQTNRSVAKEDALPKDYNKAKKSKKELVKEFEQQLAHLKHTCEIKADKTEFLQKQLNSLDDFLKTSLRDPNMDYTLQLLFSDITSVIKEMNSYNLDLDTFSRLYRMFYNLPENRETASYPDYWAQVIAQSIECI